MLCMFHVREPSKVANGRRRGYRLKSEMLTRSQDIGCIRNSRSLPSVEAREHFDMLT